jgi:tRNA threonylcarbamoyladenosine modification (KEOPS) complex Cgi121 subunit
VGKDHFFFAVTRAYMSQASGTMKTKALCSEVVYQLSSSSNINETVRQFGASGESKNISIIFLSEHETLIDDILRGKHLDFVRIEDAFSSINSSFAERFESLKVLYKLTEHEQSLHISDVEDAVLTRIAVKDI